MPRVLETCLRAEDLDAAQGFCDSLIERQKRWREGDRHVVHRAGDAMLPVYNPTEIARPAPPGALPVPAHGARGPGPVCFAVGEEGLDRRRGGRVARRVAQRGGVRGPASNSVEFAEPGLWAR